ncbi:MAG: hypothetical protein NW241_19420 [Bacteroidia bacterium]|nr:hypothetical protein [Bacteroidia bacterium]
MSLPVSEVAYLIDSACGIVYYNEYNQTLVARDYSGQLVRAYYLYQNSTRSWYMNYSIQKSSDKILFSTNAALLIFDTDLHLLRDVVQQDFYDSPEGPSLHHRLCRFWWELRGDTIDAAVEHGYDCTQGEVKDTLRRKVYIGKDLVQARTEPMSHYAIPTTQYPQEPVFRLATTHFLLATHPPFQ